MDDNLFIGTPSEETKVGSLQRLKSESSLEKLERGVEVGVQILGGIKSALAEAKDNAEIASWIKSISKLQGKARPTPCIVGVVGSTGAGKSSVLNAVLDEECLVPTNCMRACTAVITEIAYNSWEEDTNKYRAEIHFISSEEWRDELQVLLQDLFDPQGRLEGDHANPDSEAGIAYSKIRAVYPSITRAHLMESKVTANGLTEDPSVRSMLGTTKHISALDAKSLLDQLRQFIDSKEKARDNNREHEAMEFWPLIKVVKIFVRTPLLESGLVLVDLPGVQDANAARSAVAAKYIERCTGLWVVAPITRAVDDKSAQNLMGPSFKRQLQLDGTFANVTVICSKTDDIRVKEAIENLPEGKQIHQIRKEAHALEAQSEEIQAELSEVEERVKTLGRLIESHDREIDNIEGVVRLAGEDDDVLISSPQGSEKRRPRTIALKSRKRNKRSLESGSDDSSTEDGDESPDSDYEEKQETLKKSKAVQRLEGLKLERRAFREEKRTKEEELKPLRKKLRKAKAETRRLHRQAKSKCIRFRNQYSRPAIQQQFADGIKELDQDNASQRDEANFDPTEDQRDYGQIAAQLPVFCVSSRAYQNMTMESDREEAVSGFPSLEDTEIPALQRHAVDQTRCARVAACRMFLNDLGTYLTSLMLRVTTADNPLKLTVDIRQQELNFLQTTMQTLEQQLKESTEKAMTECRQLLDTSILSKFAPATRVASDTAPVTVESWGRPKNEGGLPFMTYRATCVRNGVFKGKHGLKDFNEELSDPFKKQFARGWELVFSETIPKQLDSLVEALAQELEAFHIRMQGRAEIRVSLSFQLVAQPIKSHQHSVRNTTAVKDLVKLVPRKANRELSSVVANSMTRAYDYCSQESGRGCFKRMKEFTGDHIKDTGHTMFDSAAKDAASRLTSLLDKIDKKLRKTNATILKRIKSDYNSLVADDNVLKDLSTARGNIHSLLSEADEEFEKVMRLQAPGTGDNVSDPTAAMSVGDGEIAEAPVGKIKHEAGELSNSQPTSQVKAEEDVEMSD
ncbi:Dynamin family-domain-containing protein [Diplogelasinospora grovesii]|uniref:Dynamin family-domain-containing protein n=1 Tax=Diplogelasinospora grovesii TaxID=303347 RepID=A0AAN6N8Z3_9PEZI|nr:Dynamin family-domain-containing protein [Diplogelasinospora grovesii]